MQPHLPPGTSVPERPLAVRPLVADVGVAGGHRLVLLSVEDWGPWADIRFGRIATPGAQPLARRIPLATDWSITIDDQPAEVLDVAGRGDRNFSNGEVRVRPAPQPGSLLHIRAQLAPGALVEIRLTVPGA
jgi:hypothetical protein